MRIARILLGMVAASTAAATASQFTVAQQWESLGPQGGMVLSLAAADNTVYLGTADGHVFASSDRGERWELRGRAGERLDGVVQRLVADTAHEDRVLAALWFRGGPGGGVFESVDGARHWNAAGLRGEAVRALEQSPSQPNVWVAGTRSGVFRSEDDARSWRRITPADDVELQNVDSLAVDPGDAQTIYVGTYHLPWKTTDGGKTWISIAAGMIDDSDIMSLRIDAQNSRRIFSSACSGIYRSEDGGASWVKLEGIPYSSRRTQQIAQDPVDARILYAATTQGLWMTADSGETWSRITGRETDANAVVVLRNAQGSRVLGGFDAQGVLRSDDRGSTFVDSNGGFVHPVIHAAAVNDGDAREWMVLVEGVGGRLWQTRDAGRSWTETSGRISGKAAERIFHSAAGWRLGFAEGGIARFDTSSASWRKVRFREIAARTPSSVPRKRQQADSAQRWRFVAPHVRALAQVDNRLVAATDDGLWVESTVVGQFQRSVAENLPRDITFLAVAADSKLLAIAGGALWSGDAQAAVWNRLASVAEAGSLLWVRDDKLNGAAVRLLGTSHGVYVAEGDRDWRLLANGLPAIGSGAMACSASHCVAAMDNGSLYSAKASLRAWGRLDLEAGPVRAILATGKDEFVLATQSEGLMVVKLDDKDER